MRNLSIRYGKKGPLAVDDVSFTIARGETLGLIGESGSGKTTIGRAILGLVPVTSGQIIFEGRDITRLSAAERRTLQGDLRAVFQDPFSSLNPRRPIGDALTEPLRVAGVPRAERDRRASRRRWTRSAWRPDRRIATRASSPAVSASASRSRGRSSPTRGSSSATRRSARSTCRRRRRC